MSFIATLLSSVLLSLALPNEIVPYGLAILGFFCLAPYFAALQKSKSKKHAALLGALFGSLSHALSSYWLYFFQDYAVWTIGATSVAYAFLHAILAVFLRHLSQNKHRFCSPALRPILLAAAWTVWEWLKSIGFLGYPWGLLPYSVNDVPFLIQISDSMGIYALSFLLALSSAIVAEFSYRSPRNQLIRVSIFGFSLFAWISLYGIFALNNPTPIVDRVPLVLVQHNADSWEQGGALPSLKRAIALSRKGIADIQAGRIALSDGSSFDKAALVVWSETVLNRPYEEYKAYFRKNPAADPLVPFLEDIGTPLLTGAPAVLDWDRYELTNSAILINSAGTVTGSYAKQHPVPFAEYIPFYEQEWMKSFMKKVAGLEGTWTMGTEATVMEVDSPSGRPLRFGVPICFEDAFPDVCAAFIRNGADILINLTNDSWSKTVSAETQHFALARFRAVENRRVLVRSTNSGVTSVVDAEGNLLATLPLFTEDALAVLVPVQIARRATTYFILGDWFPLLLALLLAAYIFTERKNTDEQS